MPNGSVRCDAYLDASQIDWVERRAEELGISRSQMVRNVIQAAMDQGW